MCGTADSWRLPSWKNGVPGNAPRGTELDVLVDAARPVRWPTPPRQFPPAVAHQARTMHGGPDVEQSAKLVSSTQSLNFDDSLAAHVGGEKCAS
jgi:hypothetical protein